ncbi:hypothetical protein CO614_10015 [Lysobacteraceae bacterium NML120232]|nr:hypothetical protein CO614_10015 [Xanthomonadaceae bacterium NML120232]
MCTATKTCSAPASRWMPSRTTARNCLCPVGICYAGGAFLPALLFVLRIARHDMGSFSAKFAPMLARLLLVGVFFSAPSLFALESGHNTSAYTVQHWEMQHGLPHNMVHSITQDNDGFIWVTSWEGIGRFNGRSFTLFDNSNVPGLEARGFRSSVTDSQGRIIFGSPQSGLWRYDRGHWQQLARDNPRLTTLLLRTGSGEIWIGTESGLFWLDEQDRLHPGPKLAQEQYQPWISAMTELADGRLLLAADEHLFEIAPKTHQVRQLNWDIQRDIGPIHNLLHTRAGKTFLNPQRGLYQKIGDQLIAIPAFESVRISAMLEDRQGNIWISTVERGLLRWKDGHIENIGEQEGLTGHSTPAIFEDNEGQIWVGTTDGLFLIARSTAQALDTRHGLDNKNVRAILHANDGSVWIGTSSGLNRWKNGEVSTLKDFWEDGSPSSVLALAQTSAGLWVGSYDRGIMLINQDGQLVKKFNRDTGLISNRIRALLADGDDVWVGSRNGLSRIDAEGNIHHYGIEYGLKDSFIVAIYKDRVGNIWTGGSQGFCVLPAAVQAQQQMPAQCHGRPNLPAQNVFDFLELADGSMLIASDRGILRWDGKTVRNYGKQHGLPNESLFRLVADAQGFLWASSNNGVIRIDPRQLDEIDRGKRSQLSLMHFTQGSGMPSSQSNGNSFPSADMDAEGNFWVSTAAGVAIISTRLPKKITHAKVPLVIEQILVNGALLSPHEKLEMASADSRRIVVRYAGLNHRHIHELRYRYRLRGFDDNWIEAGNGTEAVFTNLPAGKFTFEVQAMAPPLDWTQVPTDNQASFDFTLTPAWWQRHSVQFAGLLLLGFGLLALLRLREHAHRKQREKLEQQVQYRTQELNEKNQALEDASNVQAKLMQRLEILAGQDELTHLPNRRSARARMEKLCQVQPIRLAMIDLDHFKHVNDRHGHETGDRALVVFARLLQQHAGELENCARLGGEEFALLITDNDRDAALRLCQSLCDQMAAAVIESINGETVRCTVSIGLSSPGRDPHHLLREADRELYYAKNTGRNRVCVAD